MVFKVWKSKFGLQRILDKQAIQKPVHAQIFFYLFISYLILFYVAYFRFFLERVWKKHRKILSPFLFAEFLQQHFLPLLQDEQQGELQQWEHSLASAYCYEKRKKRTAQLEQIIYDGGIIENTIKHCL